MNAAKEVYFWKYCCICRYQSTKEDDAPCDECLGQGWNIDSHIPVRFERKDYNL